MTRLRASEAAQNSARGVTRRALLRQLSLISLVLPFANCEPQSRSRTAGRTAQSAGKAKDSQLLAAPPPSNVSPEDDSFLEELEHSNFLFFWEQANPDTGLIKDRCNVRTNDKGIVASIASLGFGLTAICIADRRGYISHADARQRVLQTLTFLWSKLATHRGFYCHFANMNTGERVWDSEVSSVDTSILLCGVLTCGQYFDDKNIRELAQSIFNRVDWTWLSEDTSLISHGWTPELGFISSRWDLYSEMMMIYLLGMGSATFPLPKDSWTAWKRTVFEYDGLQYIGSFAPLFVHQYSQAWFDFRNKRDKYTDYFQNSVIATDAHRRFCLDLNVQFSDYSNALWGITASDSAQGYVAWGGPPATGPIDGTIVPSATGGSLPFQPAATMRVLRTIRDHYPKAWSRYGFVEAFNPLTDWYDTDVVGIDTGITMLMAENLRTGLVWEIFMKSPEAQRGMALAEFKPYSASYA